MFPMHTDSANEHGHTGSLPTPALPFAWPSQETPDWILTPSATLLTWPWVAPTWKLTGECPSTLSCTAREDPAYCLPGSIPNCPLDTSQGGPVTAATQDTCCPGPGSFKTRAHPSHSHSASSQSKPPCPHSLPRGPFPHKSNPSRWREVALPTNSQNHWNRRC